MNKILRYIRQAITTILLKITLVIGAIFVSIGAIFFVTIAIAMGITMMAFTIWVSYKLMYEFWTMIF